MNSGICSMLCLPCLMKPWISHNSCIEYSWIFCSFSLFEHLLSSENWDAVNVPFLWDLHSLLWDCSVVCFHVSFICSIEHKRSSLNMSLRSSILNSGLQFSLNPSAMSFKVRAYIEVVILFFLPCISSTKELLSMIVWVQEKRSSLILCLSFSFSLLDLLTWF